jgi:hypothetical protein
VLAANVPQLQVHVRQGDGGHVLADGGHGLELGGGRVGDEEGLDLLVEGCLAGIVEAEEDDGVFYAGRSGPPAGHGVLGRGRTFFASCVEVEAFGKMIHLGAVWQLVCCRKPRVVVNSDVAFSRCAMTGSEGVVKSGRWTSRGDSGRINEARNDGKLNVTATKG